MAKRDILKEAIADAKTVKETAIANAKAALEEAFTPQLKSMLATKLEEMELEEEEALEEMSKKEKAEGDDRKPSKDEKGSEGKSNRSNPNYNKKDTMEEDLDEEINLDEILAEIDEEMEKDNLNEDEATDKEEEGYLDGKEDGEEEEKKDMEDEEIDLDDMTDDDLKGFIEDVIADMVASGELEAGENFEEEGEEEEVDVDVEDDVDVEVSEGKKKKDDKEEVKESTDVDEVNTMGGGGSVVVKRDKDGNPLNKYDRDFMAAIKDDLAKLMKKVGLKEDEEINEDEIDEVTGNPISQTVKKGAKNPYDEDFKKAIKADLAKLMKKIGLKEEELDEGHGMEMYDEDTMDESEIAEVYKVKENEELKEAYDTIESLKSDLNEVNLLNAKLLYTNKIFKAKTLTESQKVKVLGAFDKAGTVKETKLVFETLNEGLKTKKSPIKESLGAASRVSGNVNTKKPIIETDPMVERFKKLAGLK